MKNKKTKILKITAIVLGSIVLAVVLIIVLVALMTGMVKKAYGEHSKHKPEISIEYQGTSPKSNYDYEKIPDENYYPTIQEAMKNYEFQGEEAEEYQKNMDEIIARFENEEYISVYYIAIKNEKETADIFAKFKIKEIEGQKKYAFISMSIDSISKKGVLPMEPAIETLYSQLSISDYLRGDGIDPENERFVWGVLCKEKMREGESIEGLRVEGKKPDGIIEFEELGVTWYYWYYENMESDKAGWELEYTLSGDEE